MFNSMNIHASNRPGRYFLIPLLLLLLMLGLGCSDDPTAPEPDDDPGNVDVDGIEVHGGNLGLVLDTREIFRKGYTAATAELKFASHPERDVVLSVDPVTNLAILSLDTDSLTTEEQESFTNGVALDVTVHDEDGHLLGQLSAGAIKLENTNLPLAIDTDLPTLTPAVALRHDLPYLIQVEGSDGVLEWGTSNNATGSFSVADRLDDAYHVAWGD